MLRDEARELETFVGRMVEVLVRTVFLLELVVVVHPPQSPPLAEEPKTISSSGATSLTISETWSEVEQAPSVSSPPPPPPPSPPSSDVSKERPVRGKLLSVCCSSESRSS